MIMLGAVTFLLVSMMGESGLGCCVETCIFSVYSDSFSFSVAIYVHILIYVVNIY